MCGRYNLIANEKQLIELFDLPSLSAYCPDYNIQPGQKILAIVQLEDGSRKAVNLHWGLIPSWSKDRKIASHLFNARAETLSEKPSFKNAFQHRRCLIPATGFFEWQTTETGKKPYHLHQKNNGLFAFGGIWEHWEDNQETVFTCAIITTAANDLIASIHERMPVIITPDNYNLWLSKPANGQLKDLISSNACTTMQITPISTHVNNPLHNDENCLK